MPAGITYEPIATTTLGSAASTVTFSSISGSYTDLVIVAQLTTAAPTNMRIRFNGDTAANYSNTTISGNGSTATSVRETGNTAALLDWNAYPTSTTTAILTINIMNYANTTTFKTFINRANNAGGGTEANIGLWRSTSAINEVQIRTSSGGNIAVGSTFTLYGITAA
jgi:hypothetical protein